MRWRTPPREQGPRHKPQDDQRDTSQSSGVAESRGQTCMKDTRVNKDRTKMSKSVQGQELVLFDTCSQHCKHVRLEEVEPYYNFHGIQISVTAL